MTDLVPVWEYLSPEAQATLIDRLQDQYDAEGEYMMSEHTAREWLSRILAPID